MSPRLISSRQACRIALTALLAAFSFGCGQAAGLPEDATPVVQPDSEQAKKAIAERDQMLRERQEQEAKARKRLSGLPDEG